MESDNTQTLLDNNIYLFFEEFNRNSVKSAMEFILSKNIASPLPDRLWLVINSDGGELDSAFALVDCIEASSVPIYTFGVGKIISSGLMVFMAGKQGHRYISRNTSIMSHQSSWESNGKDHELVAIQKEFNLSRDRMIHHYSRCTGLSHALVKKKLLPSHDVWLSVQEAIKYNIADDIKDLGELFK